MAALLGGLPIETGILSQYAEGVMPGVVEARQGWDQLPDNLSMYDGFVAAWDCERIGDAALLSIDGGEWLTVLVTDCSGHKSTTDWMISQNVIFEISGELAAEHDVVCLCAVPGEMVWLN
jgi:hypothetical protein